MTNKQTNVGDVVAWIEVPSGALSRLAREPGVFMFYLRNRDSGWCVGCVTHYPFWERFGDGWVWQGAKEAEVAIIALGAPADATADDLRTLAAMFEVVEWLYRGALHGIANEDHVCSLLAHGGLWEPVVWCTSCIEEEPRHGPRRRAFAERLYCAGWRPGMTAEDAARLLVEAG